MNIGNCFFTLKWGGFSRHSYSQKKKEINKIKYSKTQFSNSNFQKNMRRKIIKNWRKKVCSCQSVEVQTTNFVFWFAKLVSLCVFYDKSFQCFFEYLIHCFFLFLIIRLIYKLISYFYMEKNPITNSKRQFWVKTY